MKIAHLLISLLLLGSASLSFANYKKIKPTNSLSTIRIDSVSVTEKVKLNSTKTDITATATASNPCMIPLASELYIVKDHQDPKKLSIMIAQKFGNRACPAVYSPVSYTIDLGSSLSTTPYDSIEINGEDETP